MTTPAPQRAAADLWNRMLVLDRDDGADLDRINWRLSKEAERSPHDFLTRLATASGLLRRGRKAEALSHLDAAWKSRSGHSFVELVGLAAVLSGGGQLSNCFALIDDLLGRPDAMHDQCLHDAAVKLGLRLGDMTLLERAGKSTGVHNKLVNRFCDRLREEGLASAFSSHQNALESVIGVHACGIGPTLQVDEDGNVVAFLAYFTDLKAEDRYPLYRCFSEALAQHGGKAASSVVSVFFSGPEIASPEEPL